MTTSVWSLNLARVNEIYNWINQYPKGKAYCTTLPIWSCQSMLYFINTRKPETNTSCILYTCKHLLIKYDNPGVDKVWKRTSKLNLVGTTHTIEYVNMNINTIHIQSHRWYIWYTVHYARKPLPSYLWFGDEGDDDDDDDDCNNTTDGNDVY